MNYPHPLLAREGWPFIGLAAVASLLLTLLWGWQSAVPAYIVLVFVVQFFRDPPRAVPDVANAVLSPADGRIVKIEKVRDPKSNTHGTRDSLIVSFPFRADSLLRSRERSRRRSLPRRCRPCRLRSDLPRPC